MTASGKKKKKKDANLLRTPAKGIPIGEIRHIDGEKVLHVVNQGREDDYKVTDLFKDIMHDSGA